MWNIKARSALGAVTIVASLLLANISVGLEYAPNKRLNAKIGVGVLNKITFTGDNLSEVVGNESEYFIKGDEAGNAYLTPQIREGNIYLTLLAKSGRSQDMNLQVVGKSAQSIVINFPSEMEDNAEVLKSTPRIEGKVVNLMRNLSNSDMRESSALWSFEEAGLVVTANIKQQSSDLTGIRGFVTNNSKGEYVVSEKNLARMVIMNFLAKNMSIRHIAAISVSKGKIAPGGKAEIYIIWR